MFKSFQISIIRSCSQANTLETLNSILKDSRRLKDQFISFITYYNTICYFWEVETDIVFHLVDNLIQNPVSFECLLISLHQLWWVKHHVNFIHSILCKQYQSYSCCHSGLTHSRTHRPNLLGMFEWICSYVLCCCKLPIIWSYLSFMECIWDCVTGFNCIYIQLSILLHQSWQLTFAWLFINKLFRLFKLFQLLSPIM